MHCPYKEEKTQDKIVAAQAFCRLQDFNALSADQLL
jgi:hypothetical protein